MAEQKVKTPFPFPNSPLRDATGVQVKESTERWSEVTLDDGTVMRIKASIMGAMRIDGEYDPQGNPVYSVSATMQTIVVSSVDSLRKPPPLHTPEKVQ